MLLTCYLVRIGEAFLMQAKGSIDHWQALDML
jgi:hypothetical protein